MLFLAISTLMIVIKKETVEAVEIVGVDKSDEYLETNLV